MGILKMNSFETNVIRGLLLTILIGLLIACGGGGGGSASTSESVVARGMITELGSIWVNGVEYETPDGGSYKNDDNTSNTASYDVGQVVSLRGTRNSDGISGTADVVEYEAEIEGEAAASNTINGVTIITDQTLTPGTRYEVSGFWINDTTLQATFIKVDDDGDSIDEVKGKVDAVDLTSITVNGVIYLYTDASLSFAVNNIVEVHFNPTTFTTPPDTYTATRVELEDAFFDDLSEGQEVEIEGAVNLNISGCPAGASFKINTTCINSDTAEWMDGLKDFNDLVTGSRAEAEGHTNTDGLLIAEKIKGRGNRVRINATASNVVDGGSGSGTLDVFGGGSHPIEVTALDGLTEIDINGSTLFSSIGPTAGLEIRGIRTGATSVLALRIKDDNNVSATEHELRAEVDLDGAEGSDISTNNITVMGISSLVDANTKLKDEGIIIQPGDGSTTPDQIDSNLDLIDDDNDPTNGPRHIVQVLIDTTNGDGSSGTPYTTEQVEIEREDD
jgi:hypothetical protein